MDVKYKSIFDPCPAGYVVPKGNAFATLGEKDKFTRVDVVLDESGNETGEKPWVEDEDGYGWYWKNCDNAYFPKAGMLSLFGAPRYTCEDIYYWSADPLPKSLQEKGCSSESTIREVPSVIRQVWVHVGPAQA